MKKLVLSLFVAGGLVAAGARSAQAITLAELIRTQGTIQVGDKLFSSFGYLATGDMPVAGGVNVVGITDPAGNFGLEFQGGFTDAPGGGTSDALISFHVHVLDPLMRIVDAHIAGNPSVIGGDGLMAVTESFLGQGPPTINIFDSVTGGVHNTQLSDQRTFVLGVTDLDVRKDIFGSSQGGNPTLSFVDQTFSQQGVPEPGVMSLLCGFGVGSSALFYRRRRKTA